MAEIIAQPPRAFDAVLLLATLRALLVLTVAGAVAWLLSGVLGRLAGESSPSAVAAPDPKG